MPENLREAEMIDVSELSEARWSVISFERCEADGLTYEQAIEKRGELERQKIAGLCRVFAVRISYRLSARYV